MPLDETTRDNLLLEARDSALASRQTLDEHVVPTLQALRDAMQKQDERINRLETRADQTDGAVALLKTLGLAAGALLPILGYFVGRNG